MIIKLVTTRTKTLQVVLELCLHKHNYWRGQFDNERSSVKPEDFSLSLAEIVFEIWKAINDEFEEMNQTYEAKQGLEEDQFWEEGI